MAIFFHSFVVVERMSEELNLKISFRSKIYEVKIKEDAKVKELKEEIQKVTNVPPTLQKILGKVKLNENEKTLKEIKLLNKTKLTIVGSTLDDVGKKKKKKILKLKRY